MVLESTMILMDNSEYQRNGDYFPNRMLVQKDGINLVSQTKLRDNPENDVGLMTCATPCQVLCTLMAEPTKFYKSLHDVAAKGNFNLTTSLRVGYLALTHRRSKIHKMRIIAFVGSPMETTDLNDLENLAKKFKKEKVNVDIICFGDNKSNEPELSKFIDAINGKNSMELTSHMLVIPREANFLHALMSSPIISQTSDNRPGMTQESFDLGFHPEDDPELALALRLSMEEERRRQGMMMETEELNIPNTAEGRDALHDMYNNFANMTEEEQFAFALQMSTSMDTDSEEEEPQQDDNI